MRRIVVASLLVAGISVVVRPVVAQTVNPVVSITNQTITDPSGTKFLDPSDYQSSQVINITGACSQDVYKVKLYATDTSSSSGTTLPPEYCMPTAVYDPTTGLVTDVWSGQVAPINDTSTNP